MKTAIKKKERILLLFTSAIFIMAMFIFSGYTSPLYPNYFGWDSAIFSLLGKGILAGKNLYTDLFDHKGPIIFLINALGYYIGGRSGVFFLQCVSGLTTIFFLYFTGKMLRPDGNYRLSREFFVLLLCAGSVLFYTMQNGNLTEEYSLPVISCSCYFFVNYARNVSYRPEHPPLWALIYGICFATLSLLRLNNSVTLVAGIFAIMVYLIYKKQYVNLFWNLVFGLVGVLIVFVPTSIYFYLHDSLDEMLYATFLHNFIIAENTGHKSILLAPKYFFILYFPSIISFILLVVKMVTTRKTEYIDGLLSIIVIMNILCLWVANRFPHYFTIFVPIYYLALCRCISFNRHSIVLWITILCSCYYLMSTAKRTWNNIDEVYLLDNPRYTYVAEDMQKIPQEERDSVIGYEIMAMDYLAGEIIPCYKYYTLQSTWAITDPQIVQEFFDWVDTNEPLWVLTTTTKTGTDLDDVLQKKYNFQFENPYICFYRLIE